MKYYIISENADPDAINEPKHFAIEVTRREYIQYANIQKDYCGLVERETTKKPQRTWKIIDDQGEVRAMRMEERNV